MLKALAFGPSILYSLSSLRVCWRIQLGNPIGLISHDIFSSDPSDFRSIGGDAQKNTIRVVGIETFVKSLVSHKVIHNRTPIYTFAIRNLMHSLSMETGGKDLIRYPAPLSARSVPALLSYEWNVKTSSGSELQQLEIPIPASPFGLKPRSRGSEALSVCSI